MGKKRLHPQGSPNTERRNGKAWKLRPCGKRHNGNLQSCTPCRHHLQSEQNAADQRFEVKRQKKLEVQRAQASVS